MTQRANFDWVAYLKECGAQAAPAHAFRQSIEAPDNKFDIGMKLEARDPRNSTAMCIATVVDVAGPRIALRLDGTDDRNDFWRLVDSSEIAPLGTTPSINDEKSKQQPGLLLQPPFAFMKREREWTRMYQAALQDREQHAPLSCFKVQPPSPARNLFAPGMKLEAVDRKNARLICVATIGDVRNDQVLVKFDGWRGTPDYWTRYDSRDLFPVAWCEKVHHALEPPGPGYTGAVGRVRVQNAPTVVAKASASVKSRPTASNKRHNAADAPAKPESNGNGKTAHADTSNSQTHHANLMRHDTKRSRKRQADENQRCKKDSVRVPVSDVKRHCVTVVSECDTEKVQKATKQLKVELTDVIANSHLSSKSTIKSKNSQQKDKNHKRERKSVYDDRSGERVKQNTLKLERLAEAACEVSTVAVAPFKAESDSIRIQQGQPNVVDVLGQPVHTACARDPLDRTSNLPLSLEIKSELKHEQERNRESSGSRSDTPSTVQSQRTVENRADAPQPHANRNRIAIECAAPQDNCSFEAPAKDEQFVKASSPLLAVPGSAARRPSFSFSIDSLLKPTESTSVRSTTPISWYPSGFVLPAFVAPPNALSSSPLHSHALHELAHLTFNAHTYAQPVAVANGSTHPVSTNATTNGSKYANGHTVGDSNSNSTTQACGECRRLLATSLAGWTVTDVTHYLSHCDTSFAPDIDVFTRHEIDGEALALLTSELLVRHLGMKLGPAVKTMRLVDELKAKLKHCLSSPLVTATDSQVERSAA